MAKWEPDPNNSLEMAAYLLHQADGCGVPKRKNRSGDVWVCDECRQIWYVKQIGKVKFWHRIDNFNQVRIIY